MFGVGWIFGILGMDFGQGQALSLLFQFLFIIIVGFQGLFICLLYPCRSKDARVEWKKWFYYMTCRSQLYREQIIAKHRHSEPSRPRHPTVSTVLPSAGSSVGQQSSDSGINSGTRGGSSMVHSIPPGLQPVDEGSPEDENSSYSSSSVTESTSMLVGFASYYYFCWGGCFEAGMEQFMDFQMRGAVQKM